MVFLRDAYGLPMAAVQPSVRACRGQNGRGLGGDGWWGNPMGTMWRRMDA